MKLKIFIFFILITILSTSSYAEEKPTLVILDLKTVKIDADVGMLLSDRLRTTMTMFEKYIVLSRDEMENIKKEIKFQRSEACNDTQCYVEIGGALGAKKMIAGMIGKLDDTYTFTLKLIDIEQAKNEKTASIDCEGKMGILLKAIDEISHKLFEIPKMSISGQKLL